MTWHTFNMLKEDNSIKPSLRALSSVSVWAGMLRSTETRPLPWWPWVWHELRQGCLQGFPRMVMSAENVKGAGSLGFKGTERQQRGPRPWFPHPLMSCLLLDE